MSMALHAPHAFVSEIEKLGFYFSKVIPHHAFDRFVFLMGDMTCHIAFNGQGYAVVNQRLNQSILKHVDFTLNKRELMKLLTSIHL